MTLRSPRRNDHGFGRASARPGSRTSFKVRGVEGWRGVACLIVAAYHVWQNADPDGDGLGPAPSVGVLEAILSLDVLVDLFFVLSGLLLFLPFAHAALDQERRVPNRREFLWRRVVRLFPVYLLVVVVVWSTRNFGFGTAQWIDLLEHLLLVQSFDSERIFHTVGPAWTLSVEWIFYLTLAATGPLLVRWARELPSRPARALRLLGSLSVVALLSVLYKLHVDLMWEVPVTDWAWRFGPAAKADCFAIGMALAVIMVLADGRRIGAASTVALVGGGSALLWCARVQTELPTDHLLVMLRHSVASLGWALVLLGVMACRSDRPARWIDNKLAVSLSLLAYCVYIVHEPVILGLRQLGLFSQRAQQLPVNMLVVLTLTLVLAWIVHRVVEEPWVDLAALQARGGGRRDLYADSGIDGTEPPVGAESAADARLREHILRAAGERDAVLTVSAGAQK